MGVSAQEEREWADADEAYFVAARRDPAIRKRLALDMLVVDLHLWLMCREELTAATVESVRESKRLLYGYIPDEQIADAIDRARSRAFAPQPDSKPWAGPVTWPMPEPLP